MKEPQGNIRSHPPEPPELALASGRPSRTGRGPLRRCVNLHLLVFSISSPSVLVLERLPAFPALESGRQVSWCGPYRVFFTERLESRSPLSWLGAIAS